MKANLNQIISTLEASYNTENSHVDLFRFDGDYVIAANEDGMLRFASELLKSLDNQERIKSIDSKLFGENGKEYLSKAVVIANRKDTFETTKKGHSKKTKIKGFVWIVFVLALIALGLNTIINWLF